MKKLIALATISLIAFIFLSLLCGCNEPTHLAVVTDLPCTPGSLSIASESPGDKCINGGVSISSGNCSAEYICNGLNGQDGFPGQKGDTGVQGIQGEQGLQGVAGSIGPEGLQGNQGLTGPVGPQGPAGVCIEPTCEYQV